MKYRFDRASLSALYAKWIQVIRTSFVHHVNEQVLIFYSVLNQYDLLSHSFL